MLRLGELGKAEHITAWLMRSSPGVGQRVRISSVVVAMQCHLLRVMACDRTWRPRRSMARSPEALPQWLEHRVECQLAFS